MGLFWHRKHKDATEGTPEAPQDVVSEPAEGEDIAAGGVAPAASTGYTRGQDGLGPYDADSDDVPEARRIDAGALQLPYVEEARIQFSVMQQQGTVMGVVYSKGGTSVQLQVFAAPKSHGIWDEIRPAVITSIVSQHGHFDEVDGHYGKEVDASMVGPSKGVRVPVRFIGIDGPRWLLRAAMTGAGAQGAQDGIDFLHEILDNLVVSRGQTPHPPRELLPLRLPQPDRTPRPERPSIELPKRGPEIQEIH